MNITDTHTRNEDFCTWDKFEKVNLVFFTILREFSTTCMQTIFTISLKYNMYFVFLFKSFTEKIDFSAYTCYVVSG